MHRVKARTHRPWNAVLFAVALASAAAAETENRAASTKTDQERNVVPVDTQQTPPVYKLLDRITVVGTRLRTPGSVHRISSAELEHLNQAYDDVHRVMLRVPGMVITEEDGFGLRPNIGMRAAGSDRSANITLMEDGILAAPAPYAAPAAYYFPIAGRMEGVEVRKGSSQIKYGPRTNGGALNLISRSIPDHATAHARVAGGSDDTRKLHAHYGDSWKRLSWLLETYQSQTDGFKRLDTGGPTGFDVEDYIGKVRVGTDPDAERHQEVTVKLGYKEETSRETYLGLTDADFAREPYRRYAASQNDRMDNEHRQGLVRHFIEVDNNVDVTTSIYRNEFDRNWYKLERANGVDIVSILEDPASHATEYAYLTGDSASPDDALSVKANHREYYAQGIETIVGVSFDAWGWWNQMEIGARYHEDEEDRLQFADGYRIEKGGAMVRTSTGFPGAAGGGDNRVNSARAVAAFVQDELRRGDWFIVPGVRAEWIETEQEQFQAADPDRELASTIDQNRTTTVVPGIGAIYVAASWLDVFAGVHKGFAPPGPGADDETEPEESINTEAGVRSRARGAELSLLGYFNDYDNLLGKDTFSSGGTGSGDLFNAGRVRAYGVEANLRYTFHGLGFDVPVSAAYTYSHAEFRSSFQSGYEPWGSVETGDELPYLPTHVVSASIGAEAPRWLASAFANYTSRMRTEAGHGDIPARERTDARVLIDFTTEFQLVAHARVFTGVQNLTDDVYIASRRPAGVRPGLPRTFVAGLKFDL